MSRNVLKIFPEVFASSETPMKCPRYLVLYWCQHWMKSDLDCFRLGKFKPQLTRPRPILVKLQWTIDAAPILANHSQLSSPLLIKPDLSPAEREIESILLKVRWSLIQKGYLRKSIKMNSQRFCIYVNVQLFGKVFNSQFQQLTSVQAIPENSSSVQSQQAFLTSL